eukprot:CAMPEP_0117483740 /NCGR_PEP_ID=MMETSP0784-20121206/14098_1 /TAXON_ID=39447 /ORGANISM="" /LENGTH=390 /DNA_ID=CAMNT_0005278291 /DNA_START=87 /DNA_END=1259 /DNA_ORIENTATION=+
MSIDMDINTPALLKNDSFRRATTDGLVVWDSQSRRLDVAEKLEPLFEAENGTFESEGGGTQFATISKRRSVASFVIEEKSPTAGRPAETGAALGSPTNGTTPARLSLFLGSRCTRVHFVRHAEGHHNVITRKAHATAKPIVDKAVDDARVAALQKGQSLPDADAAAAKVKARVERVEENRPVHYGTDGAEVYTDAVLTEAGRNQCYALRGKMDRNSVMDPLQKTHVELVVVSPLKRCLETAEIIFGPGRTQARPDLKPFVVHDMCRERYGEFYCDKRSKMSETRQHPAWRDWDWESQKQDWPENVMPFSDEDSAWAPERESEQHIHDRAMHFLHWLAKRPEREIAVVTHSSFLKNLFKVFGGDTSLEDQDVLRAVPANCELRTVVLCHHG